MSVVQSKRGRQLLPTDVFTQQQISFLDLLHKEADDSSNSSTRHRYISHFGNHLRAAASPQAVLQLMELPIPTTRLRRQAENKLRQLTRDRVQDDIAGSEGASPLPQPA